LDDYKTDSIVTEFLTNEELENTVTSRPVVATAENQAAHCAPAKLTSDLLSSSG
jgi:hypothetical protein